jgi:hypothetical protein
LGDVHRDPDRQAPAAPPTLRAPGEKLPTDDENAKQNAANRTGTMQPVVFPKDTTKEPARTIPAHPAPVSPDAADTDAAKTHAVKPVTEMPDASKPAPTPPGPPPPTPPQN